MGFALVGLAAGTSEGVQGVLVYMAIYVAMTLGTFACIISMRRNHKPFEEITDLSGLARTNPAQAFVLAMLLFSLAACRRWPGFLPNSMSSSLPSKRDVHARRAWRARQRGRCYYYLLIVKIM